MRSSSDRDALVSAQLSDEVRRLYHSGDVAAAAAALERVIRDSPGRAVLWVWLGDLLGELEQPERAEHAFRTAIHTDPDLAGAHSGLARLLQDAGRHVPAIAEFEIAVRLGPTASRFVLMASSREAIDDTTGAEADLRRALALDADNTEALVFLARLRRWVDLSEARALLTHALSVAPNDPDANAEYGSTLLAAGESAAGLTALQVAEAQRPDDPWLQVEIGNALETLGIETDAERCFVRATELAPQSGSLLMCLSDYYHRTGQRGPALDAARRAVQAEPGRTDLAAALDVLVREHEAGLG